MLDCVHVKNLALIQESEIMFSEGLNILTGETGAGKSIIIDSISFALGERNASGFLREGETEGMVELYFSDISQELKDYLRARDIDCEGNEVILRRKLSGRRSVANINGEGVAAGVLKEAAGYLIDIHGQHEHQSLLSESRHLSYLDSFAGEKVTGKREQVKEIFYRYRDLKNELDASDISDDERLREMDLLTFEIDEITDAGLTPGEDTRLEEEFRRMKNFDKIVSALGEASGYLRGDRGAEDAIDRAATVLSSISGLDGRVDSIALTIDQVCDLVRGAGKDINAFLDDSGFDPERFDEVTRRLDTINHLKDKFGGSIEQVMICLEEKKEKLDKLKNLTDHLEMIKKKLGDTSEELSENCIALSDIRKEAAKKMEQCLVGSLKELNFLDVRFKVEFAKKDTPDQTGSDDIRFLISTNPGEPLKPLVKVASGGEMSRIMLGLKSIMADKDKVPTLIFDEIDTGISGETANKVAVKMRQISKDHQVICITHLPQIASAAEHHFLIEKNVEEGVTISNIRELREDEINLELSRMIGGDDNSETIRKSASEMRKKFAEK